MIFFFFSSRRRHTRLQGDWSSDVCSSDLMLAADTLLSYGSMAMFRDCDRLMKVNDQIVMGGGGDYADFQYIQHAIEERV